MFHIVRVDSPGSVAVTCNPPHVPHTVLEWHERQRRRVLESVLVLPTPADRTDRRDG
jgi:hypothetical protein